MTAFSRRVPRVLAENALSRERAASGPPPFDLTAWNPTACGIPYPPGLLGPLSSSAGEAYAPDPRGLASARREIAAYYADRGAAVDPSRIVLTASSSEAYGFLFKTLCDPGDAVLVPVPSYPLFEHLAALDAVRSVPWPLDPHAWWAPRLDDEAARREGARAAVVVHPNNPTGSAVEPGIADALLAGCRKAGIALIADEVFLDYPLDPRRRFSTFAARDEALTFTLGGLSKCVGLPQLKLSWIVVGGVEAEAEEALARLEFVADAYLSVATPVQAALPALLRDGAEVRRAILERCRANLRELLAAAASVPAVGVETPDGGWSVVLRIPRVGSEEEIALRLLREEGVAVHPGYFFDFPSEGRLVLSLLPPTEIFAEGARRLLSRFR